MPTLWIDGRYPAAVADAEPTGVVGQSPYNQFTHAEAFMPVDLKVVVRPMRYFQVAADDSQRPLPFGRALMADQRCVPQPSLRQDEQEKSAAYHRSTALLLPL